MRTGYQLRTILLVAIVARMALFALVHPWTLPVDEQLALNSDSALYHWLGISLEESGKFDDTQTNRPNALYTPGYPLFIAGIYTAFGHVPWLVVFFQLILDLVACALLYKALRQLFGEKPAFAASIFYALDPIVLLYGTYLLSEALCSFFLIAALYFGVRATSQENFKSNLMDTALSALCIGLATLVRPAVQFLPLFLILYLVIAYRRQWKTALVLCAVTLLVFSAVISPWLIRNYSRFDTVVFSTSGSFNLLSQNVAQMEAGRRGVDMRSESRRLIAEADAIMVSRGGNRDANPFSRANYEMEVAKRYIKNDMIGFAWYHVKGTANMFVNLGTSDYHRLLGLDRGKPSTEGKNPIIWALAVLIALFFLAAYVCILFGLKIAWKSVNRTAVLFLLICAAYFIITPGAFALARFKIPVMIFLYAFAGVGFVYLSEWYFDRRVKSAKHKVPAAG